MYFNCHYNVIIISFTIFWILDYTCGQAWLKCGISDNRISIGNCSLPHSHIVGGTNSKLGTWPWQLAILHNGYPLCGAILIDPSFALTAAHCTQRMNITRLRVVGNVTHIKPPLLDSKDKKLNENIWISRISHIYDHNTYTYDAETDSIPANDISLLVLESPANISKNLNIVCLPVLSTKFTKDESKNMDSSFSNNYNWNNINITLLSQSCQNQNENVTGEKDKINLSNCYWPKQHQDCYTSGWGAIGYHEKTGYKKTRDLQEACLQYINPVQCKEIYNHLNKSIHGMICAGNAEGKSSTCVGDSGGPLTCKLDDGKWYLMGIMSWGPGPQCDMFQYPPVFVSVHYQMNWIVETIQNHINQHRSVSETQ